MCEFCTQHGEGKKWYLQAKNYSAELLNLERIRYVFDFVNTFEEWAVGWSRELDRVTATDPSSKPEFVARRTAEFKREHYGQVVPLEEVEQILDMTISVVRFPCVCRSTLWGRYDARYCFGITTLTPHLGKLLASYPDFSGDLEVLTKEEAKKAFQEHDGDGLVHTVWTLITPFIGAICNCTSKDCLGLRARLRFGLPVLFKGEYIARIDWERCTGCRDCMTVCNFGAIGYSAALDRCFIDPFQCYGCGACRAVCPHDAITLHDRNAIPALEKEW